MGASPAVYRPVTGRAAVPPPSRMRAREATLSPGDGLAGISCCRDVVAAGVVAPRRRATAGAEERVVTQTAGGRPAGQRLTPETGHRPTPTAAASPAPTTGRPELAAPQAAPEAGPGFRHVTGWERAGFRHVTRWAAAPSRPPRRRRPLPAASWPRTPAGDRTGGSTSGAAQCRAARSGGRTSRRGGRPGAGSGSPQRHILSARHRPGRARHFRRRFLARLRAGFRTCRTRRGWRDDWLLGLAEDRPLRRQDRGQRPRLLPPVLRRPRPAAPGPAVEPGAARHRVRPRDRTAAPPAPPRLRRLARLIVLHVQISPRPLAQNQMRRSTSGTFRTPSRSTDSTRLERIPHTYASRPNGRTNPHRSHT